MSARSQTAAPKGRKERAQGEERSGAALGNEPQNSSSPKGAQELPAGWEFVRLGDIAQTTSGALRGGTSRITTAGLFRG